LRFGAVDYRATVYVNGNEVGQHDGGYTPFVLDITNRVHRGTNEIAVRVLDPSDKETVGAPGKPGFGLPGVVEGLRYSEIPHGKQSWYVQTGGMWQPVTLEFRPATYIDRITATPELDGAVHIDVALGGDVAASGTLLINVRDRHGAIVLTQSAPLTGKQAHTLDGTVDHPELWSPDDPALYTVEATAGDDTSRTRFGFRRIEARAGKLYLNGQPFFMIGALDQDFYPDTIYSPPSAGYIRREMEAGRKLGLNTLRCHIKVCEPEYLDAADETGMLVWYEIPNWDHFSAESAARGEKTLEAMVARDWNHPSIVIQSIINESWGIDLTQADQRKWLADMYSRAHAMVAPLGRLVVDNSACCNNFHVHTDLNDFHQYYSIPDHAAQWDQWVADFATAPAWTFSPYGDAQRSGSEPLIVSEFGNWGLPELPEKLPWWFRRDKGGEITQPAGVFDRFRQYKLDRVFPDYNELARATQWHEFLSLKHEIETIRQQASIQGYVITEFTDLNWESNGLLTMWRDPKVYAGQLAEIQQPDIILAHFERHDFTTGETAKASLLLSHFGTHSLKGSTVYWWTSTGQSGQVPVNADLAPQSTAAVGEIAIPTNATSTSVTSTVRLFLELRDAQGEQIAQN
ncbi:MAG: glycoside hydrolase family 2 protein, partial [Terriglobales bacterium]